MAAERQLAIVTGAASGIGRAMAFGLLQGGIDVLAVDKEAAWLDELRASAAEEKGFAGELRDDPGPDLSDPAAFEPVVSVALGASGKIDILVNNAGFGQGFDPGRPAASPDPFLGDHAGTMEPLRRGSTRRRR